MKIKNAILLCLLFSGIQLGTSLLVGILFGSLGIDTESIIFGITVMIIYILSFGIIIFIGYKKSKQKFNEVFKFNKVSMNYWLAIIVFMFGFIIISSEIDNVINYFLPMPEFFQDTFDSLMGKQIFIISFLMIGILPALLEEMFFRGVVLNGFYNNYSEKKAILISALLFGLIHLNPWQFVTAFIIGIIMAWVCIKTKSILLCIYMHLFNNLTGVIVLRLRDVIKIRGFNTAGSERVFQPLWFDALGAVIVVFGVLLLIKAYKKGPVLK